MLGFDGSIAISSLGQQVSAMKGKGTKGLSVFGIWVSHSEPPALDLHHLETAQHQNKEYTSTHRGSLGIYYDFKNIHGLTQEFFLESLALNPET